MSTEEEKFCRDHALEIYDAVGSKFSQEGKSIEACMMSLCICIAQVQFSLNDIRDTLEKLVEKK